MALMMGAVYAAFKEVGASDASATKAAEELTTYNDEIATLKADMQLVKWMLGFSLAMSVAILFVLFRLIPHS